MSHAPGQVARNFEDRPLLVLWETTTACELACLHCRADAQPEPSPEDLSTTDALAMIDALGALGSPRPILIMTGGDCLARPDLLQLVRHAKSLGLPVAVSPSVTPRLDAAAIASLRELGVRSASVSLDGATPRSHDALRGIVGHFEATLERIEALKSSGFSVQVNSTVTDDNLEELAELFGLLWHRGVDVWEVFFLINTGRGRLIGAPGPDANEDVCHFLVDASRYGMTIRTVEAPFFRRVAAERDGLGDLDVDAAFDVGPRYRSLRGALREQLGVPTRAPRTPSAATRDGKGVIFVAHHGDVYPSGFLPLRLGNVKHRSLVEIYRDDPVLRSIRRAEFDGVCGACAYADLCGGSRARAFATSGDPLGDDPGCLRAARANGALATARS